MFRNRGITKQLKCQCDLNPDLTPEQEICIIIYTNRVKINCGHTFTLLDHRPNKNRPRSVFQEIN